MTRIAVISDIHGNAVALDAVLADIERAGVDQIVCLGDAIQGGAQPAQTVRAPARVGLPGRDGQRRRLAAQRQSTPGARRSPQSRKPCASGRSRSSPRPTAPSSPPSRQP